MAELKKVLNYPILLLIVINSILGTGIFFLPGIGAKVAGAASIISWGIISIIAIYISMCFGELCSMFPTAGGVYEFCKQAYGRTWSFLIGWLTLIAGNITIAMLIIGGISYLLPPNIPNIKVPIMIISVLFIIIFNFVAYRGMKISATMLVAFSFITLGTLFALMIPSFIAFNPSNLSPFFKDNPLVVFLAIFFIAETFFGWESPTFLAGETKDGHKIVPKAIIHGTIIIALIALLFVISSLGSLGAERLGSSSAPLSDLAFFHFGELGMTIFMLLVYLAIIGSVADWVVSAPRLILSMANDKLFLPNFSKIHKDYHTPYKAILFQCGLSIIFVFLGLGSYETLLHLLVPMLLVIYSFVVLAVVILRYKRPELKRHFSVPFAKIGPFIVIAFFLMILGFWLFMTSDAWNILLKGVLILSLGIPVYLLLEMYYSPRAVRKTNNFLAYFMLLTERLSLPKSIRKEIVRLMGDIKGKSVLEFGCSVGTLTMHLAQEVGNKGKIYATDISERDLDITKKRLLKKGHKHVVILHDLQHAERIHPKIPRIHTVVSVGMLGYLQDVKKVLYQMNKKLKIGSKVCFVDYDKFLDIIPNIEWLEDDFKIRKIFKESGFNVQVVRKQGIAWNYVYVFGTKVKNCK